MPTGDVYRLVMNATYNNLIQVRNTLHVRAAADGLSSAILTSDMYNYVWTVSWRAAVTAWYRLDSITASRIGPTGGDDSTWIVNEPGSRTGQQATLPAICAGVITWRTAVLSRRTRGRMYVSCVAVTGVSYDGTRLQATDKTHLANISARIGSVFAAGGPSSFRLIVFSRSSSGAGPPYASPVYQDVNAWTNQDYICAMGTRRWGRGV